MKIEVILAADTPFERREFESLLEFLGRNGYKILMPDGKVYAEKKEQVEEKTTTE